MKIFVLLPIIGASLNLCAKDFKPATKKHQTPIAIAGQNKTIYLTQTSTATLDGSASSDGTYKWDEISSDYMSGGKITSPNSKVTTVTDLPQGVFYFRLSVNSGGITARDSMKVVVDYAPPPKNSIIGRDFPIRNPDFVLKANMRDDTTDYLGYDESYNHYYHSRWTVPADQGQGFIERARTPDVMVDSLRGKLYNTIEDGWDWNHQGYCRSQINYGDTFSPDTNKTYVFNWKLFFPQSVYDNFSADPVWGRVTCWDIHGDDDGSGQFGIQLARDSLVLSDGILQPNGSFAGEGSEYIQRKLLNPTTDMLNKTNTIRITYREGKGYPGQKAFIKIEVNGILKYYRNVGQVGKTPGRDYIKITGLYDYNNLLVDVKNKTRGRKFSMVTEDGTIYVLDGKPTVDAGADQTISGTSIALSGTANDEGVSGTGIITSYKWTKLSGGSSSIVTPNSANTSITGLSNGTYLFQLKATDDSGIDGYDTVQVVVNNTPTAAPVLAVSNIQTIYTVSTAVSATVNWASGHEGAFYWTQVSGPDTAFIQSYLSDQTFVKNLKPGTYIFRCLATQDDGQIAFADATVIVVGQNIPPTADAGNNQSITLPTNTVNLNGAGTDEDGTIASYQWTKIAGTNSGSINNSNSPSAKAINLSAGTYQFELTVTDNKGATAKDTVQVTVNEAANIPPTADAGNNQSITLPTNSVNLDGTGADADGTIASYQWTKISGPNSGTINKSNSQSATAIKLSAGVYQFELTVTDNKGATAKDTVNVTVNEAANIAPTADAGNNQSITLPTNSVNLNGTGADVDGTIVSYQWTKISGPNSGTINKSNSSSATAINLSAGVYQFELTVTDNKGATAKDTVNVTVNEAANIPPTANAGNDQSITLPTNTVNLNGAGADEDGTITSYQWTKISGPNSGSINNGNSASATATNLVAGVYQFELTVTDNKGAAAKDTVQVTANEAVNIPPAADAGNNQSITLPTNSVSLDGTGADEDGTIASYQWTKISGPNSGTINKANSSSATAINLSAGVYQFELTVTDNKGATAKDTVEIKVNEAANIPPTANAGNNQSITLPTNTVNLDGTGTDEDGTIASYQWTKISGPNSGTINKANSASATAINLSAGVYQFELTVTDNKGVTAKDTVNVTVNEAANIAPTADAGNDQSITLPTNSVNLDGTGTDEDGTITSYQWTKIAGPNSGTINKANSASATATNLSAGVYQFELTVTDNKGAAAKDTVHVTVNEAANIAPTADAGNNQSITLPTNSVNLDGTGADADGTIASYQWTKISGPNSGSINKANSASATATNLSAGVYQFELTVTDNKGAAAKDTVQVTVNEAANIPPTADAGNNQSITLPTNTVNLNGTGADEDGTITSYQWIKISGPNSGTINKANSASATAINLSAGVYQFELTVTDNKGATAKDTVQVTVNEAANIPPTANAGNNQSITLPTNSVNLDGTGTDEDGTITSYQWTKISGPNSGSINKGNSASAKAINLSAGVYQFELTVTDNKGATAKDTVQVTVNEAANIPPTANAGSDKTITLPTNSVAFSGSGQDEDGTIASYQWTKISGPNSGSINKGNSASAKAINLSAGVYQFELTVTDNKGATAKDTVQVTVNEAANIPPTANAGSDKTITLPTNSVAFSGSGQDEDGTIASYQWTKISGPNSGSINNGNSASATATNLSAGVYQFELTVTDNKGATAKDTVNVTVNEAANIAPTADAGNNQSITLPTNSVSLDGTGADADGTIVSYQWTKISGPNSGTINKSNSSSATAINLSAGVYQFELTVTDNKGATAKDTVNVTVNEAANIPPTADAGNDQSITLPTNSVNLDGTGTDADGTITSYQWTKISGPSSGTINKSNSSSATANNLSEGTYQFELTVTDNKGATAKDTVNVTVNEAANIAPTANAGNNQSITLPTNSVSLNGTGADVDGTIVSYQWTKIAGPNSGTINKSNSQSATAINLSAGTYQFELTVTDNKGATAKDTVNVTVNEAANIPPTADAGNNQNITLPTNTVSLDGTGTDEDGTITSYQWTKISGPNSGTINKSNSQSATAINLSAGTYQFELTVTDNKGATAKDSVQVTVNEAANIPPTADAGNDQSITLPTNSVNLDGTGADADGTIASYQWTKISGPNSGTINKANSASATAINLSAGVYQFELTVTDNKGVTAKDTVNVTVNEAANIAPTADAGNDQSITLPTNSVNLDGTGTDEDGTITSYQWTKIAGPNSGTINKANSASATATNLSAGVYQFELTVTDNKGAIAKDTVNVTVNEAVNIPPTADAGNNQSITLPTNSVSLDGTGADADGTITSYQWTKISGPNSGTINKSNSSSATANNLSEGTYQFELTVTDNKGAAAKDTVQVTVNEAANIPPTANAGNNKTITLPTNSVSLDGTGADEDGTITSYQWIKISGPNSGTINKANSASATAINLSAGVYQFELTVTDNKGAAAKDTVNVTVNEAVNIPPTANAGNNQSITLPTNSVSLDGTGADADGTIVSYQWTKISGPNSGTINKANSASATAINLSAGVYQFELTVTDNKGAAAKDTVQVTVNEAVNIPPTANAGNNQSITLPTNSVSLDGTGADADGTIVSYQWTKIAGPNSGTINKSNSQSATAINLSAGVYQFELTVTDNKGATAKDTVNVTVNEAANIPPTADAGNDQSITLPTNSVNLDGTGTDADGTITSYQWIKISGPNSGTINKANSASATVNNLSEGTYQFEFVIEDNNGAIAKDTMQVKVNPAENIPPTADAGKDTTILYPASNVILNGKGIDSDGEIATYSWKQISGPSESIISSGNTSSADISELKEGTYEFEFIVTDKNGAVGKDSVKVTVALGRLAPEVNSAITVYPNPVHDLTTADINTGRANTNILITITDMSGKTVYKKQMVSSTDNVKEQINMTNFSKGTYVITIFFDNVLRKSIKVLKL